MKRKRATGGAGSARLPAVLMEISSRLPSVLQHQRELAGATEIVRNRPSD
jgi:hypothetical protein